MMAIERNNRPGTKQRSGEADDGDAGEDGQQGRQRKPRNSGDILARRRFENIRKHSARTRHRTGIINTGEKNRLTIAEKQMVKARRVAEARILRMKVQLNRELQEMEAGKRALRRHSICVKAEDRDKDRQELTKYCQRGKRVIGLKW